MTYLGTAIIIEGKGNVEDKCNQQDEQTVRARFELPSRDAIWASCTPAVHTCSEIEPVCILV